MVVFQNPGLINLHGITTFGVCAKPEVENPIGYFGTGLKYALAVLLREGCTVELWRDTKRTKFKAKKVNFRGTVAHQVYMGKKALPYTTELGKNWELWMAYRELAANAYDEGGRVRSEPMRNSNADMTCFIVEGDAIDKIHTEHKQIFLSTEPTFSLDGVDIHDDLDSGSWLFYRGIRVYELPKRAMYNYNITAKSRLTEDRTFAYIPFQTLAKAISNCNDPVLIRRLLLADQRYFESTIDYNWWSWEPGECFNKIVQRLIDSRTSYNTSAGALYRQYHPEEQPPDTVQIESIPIEQRRKLWAALMFWQRLDLEIPKAIIHVTQDLGRKKGKIVGGHIYLSQSLLEMDMRHITGKVYKLYAETRPTIGNVKQEDLLIDTIVDFGERLLGVDKRKSA
jgi:hypothetical protein